MPVTGGSDQIEGGGWWFIKNKTIFHAFDELPVRLYRWTFWLSVYTVAGGTCNDTGECQFRELTGSLSSPFPNDPTGESPWAAVPYTDLSLCAGGVR